MVVTVVTQKIVLSHETLRHCKKNLDLRSLPSLPSSSEHKNGENSDGTFTKGKRDERNFLITCTIEGCIQPNTNGGNNMCEEHWQAHKQLMLIRAKSQSADINEVEKDQLTD